MKLKLEFTHENTVVRDNDRIMHFIYCHLDNKYAGHINFFEYRNINKNFFGIESLDCNENIPHILYFQKIYVESIMRQKGIATEMYLHFSKIYENSFSGLSVFHQFENPIAEYTLKKNIELGLVPKKILEEEFVERGYDYSHVLKLKDYKLVIMSK